LKQPRFKPRALCEYGHNFWVIINGTAWARIYLDDTLVWNDSLYYEYEP
jgi:hypothetical protein